jgi:hypothetical protein
MNTDFSSRTCWILPIGLLPELGKPGATGYIWSLVLGRPDETTSPRCLRNNFVRIGVASFKMTEEPDFEEARLRLIRLI